MAMNGAQPAPSDPRSSRELDLDEVGHVVRRARSALARAQLAHGSWNVLCDLGPSITAQVAVTLTFLGQLAADDRDGVARFLTGAQLADGGFPGHPFASSGDLSTTACVWAALRACGRPDDDPAIAGARTFVERSGGIPAVLALSSRGDLAPVFLALAGVVRASDLPAPSSLFAFAPGAEYVLELRMSVLVPLRKLILDVILRRLVEREGKRPSSWLSAAAHRLEERRCLAFLDRFRNRDGSWLYGDTLHASLALVTLRLVGVPDDDERVRMGLAFLRQHRRVIADANGSRVHYGIFATDVWTTAFVLRAMLADGSDGHELRHGVVERGVKFLVDCQRSGTWAFQATNTAMPDCDDVGVVLGPLADALKIPGALSPRLAARTRAAVDDGARWLLDRQNRDGGWASFQHDLKGKPPGPIMTGPPPPEPTGIGDMLAMFIDPPPVAGDPATEDVTGRVLHGLGAAGWRVGSPSVDRAIAFLQKQQCAHGGWWGRWVVNYLAATSWVLRGLAAVRADLRAPYARRAIDFLLSHQNQDGGFGEDVASYRDPALAGIGPSTPGLTGLVLSALLEAGEDPTSDAVQRAVAFLIGRERDGHWPNGPLVHCLIPPDLFYVLPGAEQQLPLEALSLWFAAERGTNAPPSSQAPAETSPARDARGRWNVQYLARMKTEGDPIADAVVRELFASGEVGAVNRMIQTLVRSDDPVPAGLPPVTRRFFDEQDALPPWADPAKIREGQDLFERWGWAVSTTLFTSSLPQLYAFPRGARVLLYTEGLEKHAWRRVVETAQFVFDVCVEGGLETKGRGIRTTQKVRLMHAAIRHMVLAETGSRAWDRSWGVPISQWQLAGTLQTFSSVVLDGLAAMGVTLSAREIDAWMHLWNVIGHLLGIRPELLPRDAVDGEALFDLLKAEWGASPQGHALANATLELMRGLIPGDVADGLAVTLVRHLAGDRCADLLGLPAADWTTTIVRAASVVDALLDRLDDERSPVAALAQRAAFLAMRGVTSLAREGKAVRFRIPDRLLRKWEADHAWRFEP